MIFPRLDNEKTLRIDDKTRLDASFSYVSPDEESISLIRIKPESTGVFYDVTDDMYLDWQYTTEGEKTISVEVTAGVNQETKDFTLTVLSEANDTLLSNDSDLITLEDDIISHVRDGRASFIDKHRLTRDFILEELDSNGMYKDDGSRYTVEDISDIEDFRKWSTYHTISLIFNSLSNAVGDTFSIKSEIYSKKAKEAQSRSFYRLAPDSEPEMVEAFSGSITRA